MNAHDRETLNARGGSLVFMNVEEIFQSTYERACAALGSFRGVSMNVETRCQYLSLLVKKYTQDLQSMKNIYKHMEPNDRNFYCANIT